MIARYSRLAMTQLWSDEHRLQTWLEIELVACTAMEKNSSSFIPAGTTSLLRQRAKSLSWKLEELRDIEAVTQHETIAFLTYLEQHLGPEARFLHLGLTSSDILDTSLAIFLRDAATIIIDELQLRLLPILASHANTYRHTSIIGRSHGVHAEPITLGIVFAGFYAEFKRALDRVLSSTKEISVGKLSGAVGIYGAGTLSPTGEKQALETLGLQPETVATQVVARDRHATFFLSLSLLATSIERMAVTIRHWQRTEVQEAAESFGKKQKGSSAMPHKKNPVLSENLCGLARIVRAEASASLENIALWHERDISHSAAERIIAPTVTTLVDFMVHRMANILENLQCNVEKMQANLTTTHELYFSEKVLLALISKGLPRQKSYEIVQKNAMIIFSQPGYKNFQSQLLTDPEITQYLSAAELAECFNLSSHLQYVDEIIDRAL